MIIWLDNWRFVDEIQTFEMVFLCFSEGHSKWFVTSPITNKENKAYVNLWDDCSLQWWVLTSALATVA